MMSKNIQSQGLSSSLGMEEETKLMQKQGIVTILSSDGERNIASSSLRRTLSADMSSKKWLSQNGFFPPTSSEKLSHSETITASAADSDSSFSSEGESSDDYEEGKDLVHLEAESIWSSIQNDKKNEESDKPGAFDIWSSIIFQKTNEDASKSSPPPPYIHPLVKRSQSALSEKSLEICTENLGSETGSDGFSSYPPSETGDAEEEEEEEQQPQPEKETLQAHEAEEDFAVPKYNYSGVSKKAVPRSFPPPLPSLTRQDGPSICMRFHRDNGRLVLEAVSVPSQNNFCAKRQDGRLLLTFNDLPNNEESLDDDDGVDVEDLEEEFGGIEEDQEEEKEHEDDETEEEEEEEIVESEIEQAPILSSGIKSVHRLGSTMNKPIGVVNRNPNWSDKMNEVVKFEEVKEVEKTTSVAKSLPPRPRVGRLVQSATSFNAYEYYWKTNSTNHHHNNSSPLKNNNTSKFVFSGAIKQTPNEQQNSLVLRGKNGDYLVHNLKSCKESRRSFLFWEPHCIATSS